MNISYLKQHNSVDSFFTFSKFSHHHSVFTRIAASKSFTFSTNFLHHDIQCWFNCLWCCAEMTIQDNEESLRCFTITKMTDQKIRNNLVQLNPVAACWNQNFSFYFIFFCLIFLKLIWIWYWLIQHDILSQFWTIRCTSNSLTLIHESYCFSCDL